MISSCRVVHIETGRVLLEQARWCDTFGSKLRGFTFRRRVRPGEGLILVEPADGRLATAIHMLFVFCNLGVIWVNAAGQIVDTRLARPWRPLYLPHFPARYTIEGQPELLTQVKVGEFIRFER